MSATPYQPKAEDVKKLREATSAPMMDCRTALLEAGGDFERAKALLHERGAVQAQKKAERWAEKFGDVDLDGMIDSLWQDVPVPSEAEEEAIRRARGE